MARFDIFQAIPAMPDLDAFSEEELEDLLVRIRTEIEVRERALEAAPPRRGRTRGAVARRAGDGLAEAEAAAQPVEAVKGAVPEPTAAPAAEAVAVTVASADEVRPAPGPLPEPQPPQQKAAPEAVPEPEPAPAPEPEVPPIKYMH